MHAPLRPSFQAEWRGLAALEPIAAEWRALAARAIEPNVFYEPAFALAAAPVFGADAGAVLVRTTGGRLAGLFPARMPRWRGGPHSMLVGWTHPFAPLGTPLVDRDEPEAVIAAWLDHLSRDPAMPARLLLPLVPEQGAFAKALDAVLARDGRRSAAFGRHERALLAPGARARRISRARDVRRQAKGTAPPAPAARGHRAGDLRHHAASADIEAALKDFLVLEASGWKGLAGTAIVNDPAIKNFVQSAVMALAADGQARIDRLLLNGTAIAATMTLTSGDTAWCWKIAYNEGARPLLARRAADVRSHRKPARPEPQPLRVDSCASRRPSDDRPRLARAARAERPADRAAALRDAVLRSPAGSRRCAARPSPRPRPLRDRLRGR